MVVSWQELYKAALVEVQPEELGRRVEAAQKAIHERLKELSHEGARSSEAQELEDALRFLRVLARNECRSHGSPENPPEGMASS